MQKYIAVLKTTVKEYFVYRLNFILWRFRVVLNLLLPLFLWSAAFEKNSLVGSYDKTQFISYLLYGNLIATFVFGTRTMEISTDINDGKIINILLKPVSFLKYHFAREVADKIINLFFSVFEILFLIWLFKLPVLLPHNIALFLVLFLNGVLISYFINLILSFIAFWTTEVWPIRFIFIILLFFVAGSYFPLDILPKPIYALVLATPFPYMFYLPAKMLISPKLPEQIGTTVLLSYAWVLGSYLLVRIVWQKGIKSFSFWGR